MKILIVEDDRDILSFLTRGLQENGNVIDSALDGEDGEYLALTNSYDIIILDWMLPRKSGLEGLKSLRAKHISTPVLILTAKDAVTNRVEGLKSGCDDYLCKPFSFEELEARIEALYRRSFHSQGSNSISFQDMSLDLDKKAVIKEGKEISLSIREFELLLFLLKHKNSYISKEMIESALWNNLESMQSNLIEVTIYNLRKKIGKETIKSFRMMGYKVEV